VGQQLLLAPVLLYVWGLETYGVWLLLAAIPSYLTLSDFGFTTIAKNEMTMRIARGDQTGAIETYQSVFLMLLVIALTFTIAISATFSILSIDSLFQIGAVSESSAKTVLLLHSGGMLLYQFTLLISSGFRGIGRPASEVWWSATARLGMLITIGVAALVSHEIVMTAVCMLVSQVVFTVLMYMALLRAAPYLHLGLAVASLTEIRRLFHPSFSYTVWIAASLILLQGPVILLGMTSSPAAIAAFSTSRTLVRLGISGMNVFNWSIMPEYSRLFGSDQFDRMRKVLLAHATVTAACIAGYIAFMVLCGPSLMEWWMSGKVKATEPMFALLIGAVAAEMAWGAAFIPLSATNRHVEVSYSYFALAVVSIVPLYLLARSTGADGVAAGGFLAQMIMLVVTVGFLLLRWRK
jgi:O-antigen/teichoic acid export membrane protein